MTKIVVTSCDNGTVIVEDKKATTVVTGLMPPPQAISVSNLADIDLTNLQNGGVLVYDSATQTWTATNKLENQIFEAGQF